MAIGYDICMAHACVMLGIPFVAAVPFLGQESRWPETSRVRYASLLRRASHVQMVCEGEYAAWKMQKRNEYMMDRATLCLALYNGKPKGGTANAVAYAERIGLQILNLWSSWERLCRDRDS